MRKVASFGGWGVIWSFSSFSFREGSILQEKKAYGVFGQFYRKEIKKCLIFSLVLVTYIFEVFFSFFFLGRRAVHVDIQRHKIHMNKKEIEKIQFISKDGC
ncbi:hypothetical protein ACOSQ2_010285 [Xanthoceras sorbifolium]